MRTDTVRPNVRWSAIDQELISCSLGCFERSLSFSECVAALMDAWPVLGLVMVGAGIIVTVFLV